MPTSLGTPGAGLVFGSKIRNDLGGGISRYSNPYAMALLAQQLSDSKSLEERKLSDEENYKKEQGSRDDARFQAWKEAEASRAKHQEFMDQMALNLAVSKQKHDQEHEKELADKAEKEIGANTLASMVRQIDPTDPDARNQYKKLAASDEYAKYASAGHGLLLSEAFNQADRGIKTYEQTQAAKAKTQDLIENHGYTVKKVTDSGGKEVEVLEAPVIEKPEELKKRLESTLGGPVDLLGLQPGQSGNFGGLRRGKFNDQGQFESDPNGEYVQPYYNEKGKKVIKPPITVDQFNSLQGEYKKYAPQPASPTNPSGSVEPQTQMVKPTDGIQITSDSLGTQPKATPAPSPAPTPSATPAPSPAPTPDSSPQKPTRDFSKYYTQPTSDPNQ